jgi:hypothetical protein
MNATELFNNLLIRSLANILLSNEFVAAVRKHSPLKNLIAVKLRSQILTEATFPLIYFS